MKITENTLPVRLPMAIATATGFAIPAFDPTTGPQMLARPGDLLASFGSSGSVTLDVITAATATTANLSYAAAITALTGKFAGVALGAFRLGQTIDTSSTHYNSVQAATRGEIVLPCVALPAQREVGAWVVPDGSTSGAASAYSATLSRTNVSFTTDAVASAGSVAASSANGIGQLTEQTLIGATSVKIRLKSQLL